MGIVCGLCSSGSSKGCIQQMKMCVLGGGGGGDGGGGGSGSGVGWGVLRLFFSRSHFL